MYEVFAVTDVGKCRTNNQDGYIINDIYVENNVYKSYMVELETPFFATVCDGVGGTDNGAYAVKICHEYLKNNDIIKSKDNVVEYLNELNTYASQEADKDDISTATTIVGIIVDDEVKLVFNVGDSQAFVLNKGFLEKVSVDDTEYASIFGDSFEVGNIKSPITQFLGGGLTYVKPHMNIVNSRYILLCSDGLTDMVSIDEMEDIIEKNKNINDAGDALLARAKENGGYDNITIVIIKEY
jgi:protein phosphatase